MGAGAIRGAIFLKRHELSWTVMAIRSTVRSWIKTRFSNGFIYVRFATDLLNGHVI